MQTFKTFLVHFGLVLTSLALITAENHIFDFTLTSNMKAADFDNPNSALAKEVKYVVKGQNHTRAEYLTLTPSREEIQLGIEIKSSSIFVPGDNPKNAQYGFRRTDVLPALDPNTALVGTTAFHLSAQMHKRLPLNFKHEYLLSCIELNGDHIYDIIVGSTFSSEIGPLPTDDSRTIRVRNLKTDVLYSAKLNDDTLYNFAIVVDWNKNTLTVYASENDADLRKVSGTTQNDPKVIEPANVKQGEWHLQVVKFPIPNPHEPIGIRSDVRYHGIQEGTHEGVLFSRMYVEDASNGKITLKTSNHAGNPSTKVPQVASSTKKKGSPRR